MSVVRKINVTLHVPVHFVARSFVTARPSPKRTLVFYYRMRQRNYLIFSSYNIIHCSAVMLLEQGLIEADQKKKSQFFQNLSFYQIIEAYFHIPSFFYYYVTTFVACPMFVILEKRKMLKIHIVSRYLPVTLLATGSSLFFGCSNIRLSEIYAYW